MSRNLQSKRTELLAEYEALTTEKEQLDEELAQYREFDPEVLERKSALHRPASARTGVALVHRAAAASSMRNVYRRMWLGGGLFG